MLRPDTASHLFKVCVLPVLEYGLPMWGLGDWTCKQWNEVEGFVAKTARWILRAPPNAPMDAANAWRPGVAANLGAGAYPCLKLLDQGS